MAGDALARANESLKSGGEVTIDTARRMGLFVVSRLAEEHGLKVKLRRNANGGGIIASILLPADVLVGTVRWSTSRSWTLPSRSRSPSSRGRRGARGGVRPLPRAHRGGHRSRHGSAAPSPRPAGPPARARRPRPLRSACSTPRRARSCPAAFEPTELPSLTDDRSEDEEREPIALPAALRADADDALADVVTPDFGGRASTPPPAVDARRRGRRGRGGAPTDEPEQLTAWSEEPVEEPDHADEHEDEPGAGRGGEPLGRRILGRAGGRPRAGRDAGARRGA